MQVMWEDRGGRLKLIYIDNWTFNTNINMEAVTVSRHGINALHGV